MFSSTPLAAVISGRPRYVLSQNIDTIRCLETGSTATLGRISSGICSFSVAQHPNRRQMVQQSSQESSLLPVKLLLNDRNPLSVCLMHPTECLARNSRFGILLLYLQFDPRNVDAKFERGLSCGPQGLNSVYRVLHIQIERPYY